MIAISAHAKSRGIAQRQGKKIAYPNLLSALQRILCGPDVPVPSPPMYLDDVQLSSGSKISNDESGFCYGDEDNEPQVFGQSELNYLVRDLGLAKESVEILGLNLRIC